MTRAITIVPLPLLVALALLPACDRSSSSGGGGDADSDTDADTDTDTDTQTSTADDDECEDDWIDCDGEDTNGCETAIADAPAEYAEYGCCHPFDEWDNALQDCDQDGYCECYGVCGDPPYEDECWGE